MNRSRGGARALLAKKTASRSGEDVDLIADGKVDYGYGAPQARRFVSSLADRLGVESAFAAAQGYEDISGTT